MDVKFRLRRISKGLWAIGNAVVTALAAFVARRQRQRSESG
jgi:hypothetical protein